MTSNIDYDLFREYFLNQPEFAQLRSILEQIESLPQFDQLIRQIDFQRRYSGRLDWPISAMIKAQFAIGILQYRTTSSFVKAMNQNASLMLTLGFELRRPYRDVTPELQVFASPSDSAMSRFKKTLIQVDNRCGAVTELFTAMVDKVAELKEDFGTRVGFDGKFIKSHSSGQKLTHRIDPANGECVTSDPQADWSKHSYYYTDAKGEKKVKNKSKFGSKAHVYADVRYELPIAFRLAAANESEQDHCKALIEDFVKSGLKPRAESFVADRGLDSNDIRKLLYENDILPVIQPRHMWSRSEELSGDTKLRTRLLYIDQRTDTITTTEHGDLGCRCPLTGTERWLQFQGFEKKRGTTKWGCPAVAYDFHCEGKTYCYQTGGVRPGSKNRIVRSKVDPDHLRNNGPLPPGTAKFKRLYKQRTAVERINSRIDSNFLMHDHCLRGLDKVKLQLTLNFTVMLAAACAAIEAEQPQNMRSVLQPLAA